VGEETSDETLRTSEWEARNFTKRPDFPYDVKLRLLAHSRSFLANQKARNAIVGAENLLKVFNLCRALKDLSHSQLVTGKVDSILSRVNMLGNSSSSHYLGSLSTRVLETRTATEREDFACEDRIVSQIFTLISNEEKILRNVNMVV